MKPNFALSLLPEGITLLHRAAGGWRRVGTVALDAPDMGKRLEAMRRLALALEPGGLRSKVVIPNDQIRYMSLDTGAINVDARWQAARAAMDGATPYALDELVLDISVDGPTTHVAAVARETLQEAEAFAVQHLFHPVSFVAIPGDHPFLGEPFFGPSEHAATLPGGSEIEADGVAIVVIGDAIPPSPPTGDDATGDDASAAPDDTGAAMPDPAAETGTAGPLPGFASRRRRDAGSAPDSSAALAPLPEAAPRLSITPSVEDAQAPVNGPDATAEAAADPEKEPAPTGLPKAPPLARPDLPDTPRPVLISPRIEDLAPDDERGRLTLFGARRPAEPGAARGGPGLGLIVTAGLLVLLLLVAAWATLFLDDGLSGLLRREPATAPASSPAAVEAPAPVDTAREGPAGGEPTGAAAPETAVATGGDMPPGPEVDGTGPRQPVSQSPDDGPPPLPIAGLPAPRPVPLVPPQGAAEDPAATHAPAPAASPGDTDPGLTRADTAALDAIRDRQDEESAADTAAGDIDVAAALTPERADAIYAASGIWLTPPDVPETPSIISLDDLYLASIDRTDLSNDAVALPAPAELDTDRPPAATDAPSVAGRAFEPDSRELVTPSPEGTLNPDGVLVYAGRPPVVPPPTPPRAEPETEAERLRKRLAGFRPRPRPAELTENVVTELPQAADRARLAQIRPRPRPEAQATAQTAAADAEGTELAVRTALRPRPRPAGLAARPAVARPAVATATDPMPRAAPPAQPDGRTPATVARHATAENVISLRKVNLIGVFGTPANRRALVRLPSGRYKKVKVGDRLDGGRVIAIGERELRYQKKGRNLTLRLPRG